MATSRRVGDYTQAGRAAANSSTKALEATMRQKPDFVDIANESIKGQSLLRRTAEKGKVAAAITKDTADTKLKIAKDQLKVDEAKSDLKARGQRMAGIVAGLGTIGSAAIMRKNAIEDAAERDKLRILEKEKLDFMKDKHEEELSLLRDIKTNQENFLNEGSVNNSTQDTDVDSSSGSTPVSDSSSNSVSYKGGAGWSALGSTLKFAEGTHRMGDKAYNTGYGYNMFDDLSKHPDTVFEGTSAAAGAYQFMPKTWARVKSHLNLPDFSAASQERAGEQLAQWRGVDTNKLYTTRAELKQAFHQMAPEWASLPNHSGVSHYAGDGVNSARPFDELVSFYESQVGYKLK